MGRMGVPLKSPQGLLPHLPPQLVPGTYSTSPEPRRNCTLSAELFVSKLHLMSL